MPDRGFPSTPRSVDIALTGFCNLACKYCFYANEMRHLSDLSTAVWKAFFAELEECAVMSVALTGGEVFTRPDLFELITSIVQHKMRFSVLTNGTLLDDEIAKRLIDTGRLDGIQISIDAATAEAHDHNRGSGSFELAIRGLKAALAAHLPTTVRVTLSAWNVDSIAETCEMLVAMGVKTVAVNDACPLGSYLNGTNEAELALRPDQYTQAIEVLRSFEAVHPGIVKGLAGPMVMYKTLLQAERCLSTGESMGSPTGCLSACNVAFSAVSVLHDGYYVPCHHLPIRLGKLGKDRLADVWLSSPVLRTLRMRHEIPLQQFSDCEMCRYVSLCTGGCPAECYAASDRLDVPNTRGCLRDYQQYVGAMDYA